MNTQKFVCLFLLSCSFLAAKAQLHTAIEFQVYPTGLIPGIKFEIPLGPQDALQLRLGYNHVRHGDAGVHEDERGGGIGGSPGYRHYFEAGRKGWFLGARVDIWANDVDWKDNIDQANEVSGNTDIIVLQPTAEGGYLFELGESGWTLAPSLAFGAEINVRTEGEEVGQGAILLIGINLGYRKN